MDIQEKQGFIQWKGTDVCMDIFCKCGALSHVDASFCYYVQCPTCKTVYECIPIIDLKETLETPIANVQLAEL